VHIRVERRDDGHRIATGSTVDIERRLRERYGEGTIVSIQCRTPQTAAAQRIEVRDRQIVRFGVRFSETSGKIET